MAPALKKKTTPTAKKPAAAAAAAAAAPAQPPGGSVTNLRTGEVFYELQPAFDGARKGDTLRGSGVMLCEGGLRLEKELCLEGHPLLTIRTPEGQKLLRRSLLLVKASGVRMERVNLHVSARWKDCGHPIAILELGPSARDFELTDSRLRGDNRSVKDRQGLVMGTLGLILGADSSAALRHVEVLEMSSSGVLMELRSTLRARGLDSHHNHGSGGWVRGGGKLSCQDCVFHHNDQDGLNVDALEPCELSGTNVFEHNGNHGLMLDYPASVIKRHKLPPAAYARLFTTPHSARNIVCRENGWTGLTLAGGVSGDFSGALIENNDWNGVRVEATEGEECVAPITLNDTRILSNGRNRNGEADDANHDRCGLVVEKPRGKAGWKSRVVGTVTISGHPGPGNNLVRIMEV